MKSYEDFFTEEALLEYLCRQRMSLNIHLHDKEYFGKIRNDAPKPSIHGAILQLMPPRSHWIRAPKIIRDLSESKRVDSFRQNYEDLLHSVRHLRRTKDEQNLSWIAKQDEFITAVRSRALSSPDRPFHRPTIKTVPKDHKRTEFRVIASYTDLVDAAVIGQCANYLRHAFDEYFLPCSFAFRVSAYRQPPKNHHDAFKELAEFWHNFQSKGYIQAFVAECDVQGFYDTLNHDVVLDCYDKSVADLGHDGAQIDLRARSVILSYLNSYSYNLFGRPTALQILKEPSDSTKIFDRDVTLQEFLEQNKIEPYGVPQGGALSVFFANLLLHYADKRVLNVVDSRDDIVYVRYCDDMIILGTSQKEVRSALDEYSQAIRKLKLSIHPFQEASYIDKASKRQYWKTKSKSTFLWGNPQIESAAIPWIGFVGYELRYDGLLRIRKKSHQKELAKQIRLKRLFVQSALQSLKSGRPQRSITQLLASLEGRLLAGGIGRRLEWSLEPGMAVSRFGWCAGFKGLETNLLPTEQPIVTTQLRQLDRGMRRQLALARVALEPFFEESLVDQDTRQRRLRFLGKPRSYAGQFETK